VVGHIDLEGPTGTGVAGSNLTGTAFEAGGSVAPGHLTVHVELLLRQGDDSSSHNIRRRRRRRATFSAAPGPGGLTTSRHTELPGLLRSGPTDLKRFTQDHPTATLARRGVHVGDALLRFRAGRYALGLNTTDP